MSDIVKLPACMSFIFFVEVETQKKKNCCGSTLTKTSCVPFCRAGEVFVCVMELYGHEDHVEVDFWRRISFDIVKPG